MSLTPTAIVCREVFDENSQPSAEEISEYAQQIGIDPISESHLLPLARDGLMQALPPPWKAYYDDKLKTHYFYNTETKVTQWDHPLDQVYKSLVIKAKLSSERGDSILDDTCVSIQDLITYEEDAKQIVTDKCDTKDKMDMQDGDSSLESSLEDENSSGRKSKVPPDIFYSQNLSSSSRGGLLAPIGRKPLPSLNAMGGLTDRKLGDLRMNALQRSGESNTFPRTAQAGMNKFKAGMFQQKDLYDDSFTFDNSDSDQSDSRKNQPVPKRFSSAPSKPSNLTKPSSEIIDLTFNPTGKNDTAFKESPAASTFKRGLTLTGGGSIFLKSNRPNTGVANDGPSSVGNDKSFGKESTSVTSDNPKGILRERSFGETVYRAPSVDKSEVKKPDQLMSEEDKKSVRFNLEQRDVDVQYDYSPSPSSNSSSDILQGTQGSIISIDKLDNNRLEAFNTSKSMMRRNSDNSANSVDLPNFLKTRKLKPLNGDDNVRFKSQQPSLTRGLSKDRDINTVEENSLDRELSKHDEGSSVTNSPTRKLIKPHPGDFIKPNLFQKPFEKLSDILKPISPDTDSESEFIGANSMTPPVPKNKLSINLMENIEFDTSAASPDREHATVDALKAVPKGINPLIPVNKKKEQADPDAKRAEFKETPKKFSVNRMSSVEEHDSDGEFAKESKIIGGDLAQKQEMFIKEMKINMEKELKELQITLEKEHFTEISTLRDRLQKEHDINTANMERAISEVQDNHDRNVSLALEKLKVDLEQEHGQAIEGEKLRLSKELEESIDAINKEYAMSVERLRQDKKAQLLSLSKNMDHESIKSINELRLQYADNLEAEKLRLIAENKSELDKMKLDHEAVCDELKKDYRSEVELVRSQQAAHLSALRERLRRERLSPPSPSPTPAPKDDASYERLRCDKRLLEDKYRCLKEKYARLKSDVKISIERRNKRREQSLTTASETEKSHSHKTVPSTDKSGEPADPANLLNKIHSANRGKRILTLNNNGANGSLKNGNNNEGLPKPPQSDNNNAHTVHVHYSRDMNLSLSDSTPHQNTSTTNSNLLSVAGRSDTNRGSPDLRIKSPNFREKSPIGKLVLRADHPKSSGNGDNDNSIGLNDISLSQSDSHTVSNSKYGKRVNIVDNHKETKEKYTKEGFDGRPKSVLRKPVKPESIYAETTVTDYQDSSDTGLSEQRQIKESLTGRSRKKLFTRLKSASTSRLNYSVSSKLNDRACSPVENLRQQLRKLEDLEEQFPDVTLNADTTAYRLRYPFPESGGSGGEVGFLRHRALVEREGVRRAKAALRRRADALRQRRRSPAAWQEECELTDMEVSLHRTKSILGEKVIRLRHIEKSLRRIQGGQENKDAVTESNSAKPRDQETKDTTLSDISSHSSGFSSTEGHSDTNRNAKPQTHSNGDFEHSTEIINSLQTLNTEIRDIWQVLNSQQQMNVAKVFPIGQLLYTDVGWQLPIAASNIPNLQSLPNSICVNIPAINMPQEGTTPLRDRMQNYRQVLTPNLRQPITPNAVVPQDGVGGGVATSLVERTRDLRDWLKQQAAL